MFRWRNIKEARKADDGAILAIWGVSFAALLGIVAMSFDMGRIGITQSELQSYADHVSLAAAGELDGTASAITRATGAAANLIADTETFGNANNTLQGAGDYTLTFLSDLPPSDLSATTSVTADPTQAAFVRVDVINHTVDLTFGAAFTALTGNAAPNNVLTASAISGFTQYACDITPLMFCLPDPSYTANGNIGSMINLRSGGNGAAWGPGDFGFLDPSNFLVDPSGPCGGLSGVQLDNCLIGAEGPITQCFKQNGVDTEPGQKVGIKAVFNVRFDMYNATMNSNKNNPAYPPAPGVLKGIVPNGGGFCIGNNQQPSPDTAALPPDDCFATSTCGGNGRFGDGNWSSGRQNGLNGYVDINYAGIDPHPTAPTRYQYYIDEIMEAGGPFVTTPILIGMSETGRRMCSNNQSIDIDRRTVVLVSKNPSDASGVQSAIAKLPDVRLEEHKSNLSELNGKSIDLASQHELIIFRADQEADKDIEAIASIRNAASRKSTLIALATDTTSLADVQRLKRAGVHDVIPETLTTEELRDLIESTTRYPVPAIITVAAGAMPLGRVITIAKARGGIGASMLAVNLADSLLDRQGRLHKVAQNRVVVVDLDMQFGSIASLLDVDPSEALFELASDGADPDWTFLDQSIVELKSGLCVLPAPASFVPLEAINPKQMGRLVEILGQKFGYVVIDLPRALVGWLAPILEQTDRMLMVTDSSVPSIRQARRLIDFYTEENLDLNVEIVINNEKKPVIKARHHIEASKILERPFVHWLPEDPKAAREAIDRGQPLSMAAKRSALAKSINKLGRATVVELAKKEENQAAIKG